MMDRFNFVPVFDNPPQEAAKLEIVSTLSKHVVKAEGVEARIYFDWQTIMDYPSNAQRPIVSAIKSNVGSICNQIITGVEKVEVKNRQHCHPFLKAVLIRNALGKSSASKTAALGTDGVLVINTIFEDSLNCSNYMEKKITTALNEFRAPAGVTSPTADSPAAAAPAAQPATPSPAVASPTTTTTTSAPKSTPASPSPAATPAPTPAPAPTPIPSASEAALFAAYPDTYYSDVTSDNLRKEIVNNLRGIKVKLDSAAVNGADISVPIIFDWASIADYAQGSPLNAVLRAIKGGIANIAQQINSAFDKSEAGLRRQTHAFLVAIILQNVPGKAASSKKAIMYTNGALIINSVFEDSMNCTYYLEKKVQTAVEEFRVPPGVTPATRESGSGGSFHAASSTPSAASSVPTPSQTTTTTTTSTTSAGAKTPASPAAPSPSPAAAPTHAAAPVTPASPPPAPKPKGRPEMEGIPDVEDKNQAHLVREACNLVKSQVITDETGAPVGAPILIDWKSILVYTGPKQNTILKTVQNNVLKLARDIVSALKAACFDPAVRNSVVVYLRSVTISHVQGSTASSAKRVTFEDGHLTLYTVFEDPNACTSYFETKIATEMGVRQKPPTAAVKPDNITLLKEEIKARLTSHYDHPGDQLISPTVPVELKWDLITARQAEDLIPNIAGCVTPLMFDFLAAMRELKGDGPESARKELKSITFSTGKDKKPFFGDDGAFAVVVPFDDKVGCIQGMKEKYAEAFKVKMQKVHIRDVIVPNYIRQIEGTLKSPVKVNPWIPVKSFPNVTTIPITFDWTSLHHFNLTAEYQITNLQLIIDLLENPNQFLPIIRDSFANVCGYDVGKLAIMEKIKRISMVHLTKPKEQRIHLDDSGTLEFAQPFNSFKDISANWSTVSLTAHLKTLVNVQIPCACQDTVQEIENMHGMLKKILGDGLQYEIVWDSFTTQPTFLKHADQYKKVRGMVVEFPLIGLLGPSGSLKSLCNDPLVHNIAKEKIKKIKIVIDPTNSVTGKKDRSGDPNVSAQWDGSTLVFTTDLSDGLASKEMRGWNYVIERALDTRPKKVARAIAAHQIGNVADLEKQFQEVLKKKISVEVKWEEFIHANEFVYWLDEPQYLAVLDNVSKHVASTSLLDKAQDAFAGLAEYKTVLPLIQQRLDGLIIRVDVLNTVPPEGDLTYANNKLTLRLGLSTLVKGEGFRGQRKKLEALLDLRATKVKEEISRINAAEVSKSLSNVIGSPVNVVVDWDNITKNDEFANNHENYVDIIHAIGEDITIDNLARTPGFGELCEYAEVKKHIGSNLKEVRIVSSAQEQDVSVQYNAGSKTLTITIKIAKVVKPFRNSSFEFWGRKIENAMNLRPLRVQGTIDRESSHFDGVMSRLATIFNKRVKVDVDWSFTKSREFLARNDYIELLTRVCRTTDNWIPLDALSKENHPMRDYISATVHTFTLAVDPTNAVHEPLDQYGVRHAVVTYKDFSKKDHIVGTVNMQNVFDNDDISNMELELKVELLITPDEAKRRAKEKKEDARAEQERQDRLDAQHREESFRNSSLRAMNNQTRELERMRRGW